MSKSEENQSQKGQDEKSKKLEVLRKTIADLNEEEQSEIEGGGFTNTCGCKSTFYGSSVTEEGAITNC